MQTTVVVLGSHLYLNDKSWMLDFSKAIMKAAHRASEQSATLLLLMEVKLSWI